MSANLFSSTDAAWSSAFVASSTLKLADFQQLLGLVAQAVWETDANGYVVVDSPSWRAYTGQNLEDWLGEGWIGAIHPNDQAYALAQWQEAVQKRQPVHAEFRLQSPDGGWRWTNVKAMPVLQPDGSIQKWLGLNMDIHDKKQAQAALGDSEARLQLALAATNLGTFVWYLTEDRTEADARALAHFGLAPDTQSTLADALASIFHPEDGPRYVAAIEQAADPAGSGTLHQQFRIRRPDGERWMSVRATTLFEGSPPAPTRIIGVLADITERKQAESVHRITQINAFQVRLSDVLRPLSDPLQIQQTVTRLALEQFGADRCYYGEVQDGQAIIRRDAARQGLASVAGVYELANMPYFKAVIEAGQPLIVNDIHTTDLVDESLRDLCIHWQVISFADIPVMKEGRPVGILCLVQDKPRLWTDLEVALAQEAAERTWVAVERARAKEALQQADRRKDEFLAMLAHELRNPLAPCPQWSPVTRADACPGSNTKYPAAYSESADGSCDAPGG